jgi:hypothetical protein
MPFAAFTAAFVGRTTHEFWAKKSAGHQLAPDSASLYESG